jgi:gas vesicle protein
MIPTPTYIRALVQPNGKAKAGKRAWGIDLETVWLPFFLATNTQGETAIPSEALGCPVRLAYSGDGSVKFGKSGRPMTKVAKELGEAVRMVKDNFTVTLQSYAHSVITDNADGYKAQVEQAVAAGKPIAEKDKANLDEAMTKAMESALAQAQAEGKHEPEPEPVAVP